VRRARRRDRLRFVRTGKRHYTSSLLERKRIRDFRKPRTSSAPSGFEHRTKRGRAPFVPFVENHAEGRATTDRSSRAGGLGDGNLSVRGTFSRRGTNRNGSSQASAFFGQGSHLPRGKQKCGLEERGIPGTRHSPPARRGSDADARQPRARRFEQFVRAGVFWLVNATGAIVAGSALQRTAQGRFEKTLGTQWIGGFGGLRYTFGTKRRSVGRRFVASYTFGRRLAGPSTDPRPFPYSGSRSLLRISGSAGLPLRWSDRVRLQARRSSIPHFVYGGTKINRHSWALTQR